MKVHVSKWGNSLAIRIPRAAAQDAGICDGSDLDLQVVEGSIVLRPARKRRRTYALKDMVDAITAENVHGETDWGSAVGREII